jgi:hypothetical protein
VADMPSWAPSFCGFGVVSVDVRSFVQACGLPGDDPTASLCVFFMSPTSPGGVPGEGPDGHFPSKIEVVGPVPAVIQGGYMSNRVLIGFQ